MIYLGIDIIEIIVVSVDVFAIASIQYVGLAEDGGRVAYPR